MAAIDPPPAPRRTYGRARPSIADDDDGPSLLVSRAAPPAPSAAPKASPAKKLLSGFMDRSADWRGSLGGLLGDAPSASQDEEGEEETEEDLKRMMAQLSRSARAGPAASTSTTTADPAIPLAAPKLAPAARQLYEFSSTTLTEPATEPPSSQNPISPAAERRAFSPPARGLAPPSPAVNAETVPIRKPGMPKPSGHARRVVESSDEEDAPRPTKSPGTPRASRSPSPDSRPIEEIQLSPGIRFTPTPTSSPSRKPTAKEKGKGKGKGKGPAAYLDRTAGESDAEDEVQRAQSPLLLSGDESGGEMQAKSKKSKHKPLNKKDKLEMQKDMARAGRQRSYAPAKATVVHLPMSSYLPDASAVIKSLHEEVAHTTPPLVPKSREIKLESSIVAFTSSEGPIEPTEGAITANLASSPTPAGSRAVKPGRKTREASEDEEIPDMADVVAKPKPKMDLAAIKAAALAAAASKSKAPRLSGSDSEDDFSVLPKGAAGVAFARKPLPAREALSRRMLPPKPEPGAHSSPHRGPGLKVTGRPKKPKDFTETHVDFAGKAWDHAGLKAFNNGTRKAGQKAGRDVVIPQSAIDQRMKAAHAAQVKAIAAKKQADWGRQKALPEKRGVDMEQIMASASAIKEHEAKEDEGIWDEDDEDGDFNPDGDEDMDFAPSGDDGEGDDGEEDEGDGIQYSGEEDAAEDDEGSIAPTEKDDEDKENARVEVDEDDGPAVQLPRATKGKRRTNRIAGSDSEDDETPRRPSGRAPLAEMPVPQPAAVPTENAMLGFDLAGFGDDEGGGFSQLFEATQINTGSTQTDVFAGLRAAPQGFLLPSQALLPGVQISDTQRERDNALVAGDMDDDDPAMLLPEKKQQYLNSQGFFTQTKPAPMAVEPTQMDAESPAPRANGLASAWSFDNIGGDDAESISPPSAVKRAKAAAAASPTQQSPAFSRLKRRTSSNSNLEALTEVDEDEDDAPYPVTEPRNAFSKLMNASKRAEAREKRRKERSNWIEGEAEESDEDNGWGRVGGSDEEGEDGEEGEDEYDPDLVNDEQVDEEEKKRQDELAEQKMREIEKADDEKREAQARDIIDGKHRSKRRGMDFYSDDEDEDGKPRRLSKKQRRKRDLGREDGLDKLEGEENVFKQAYEADLESDEDDTLDDPLPISPKHSHAPRVASPEEEREPRRTMKEKIEMLKRRGLMNRQVEVDDEEEQRRLDEQVGFTDGFFNDTGDVDMDEYVEESESQFSVSRVIRTSTSTSTRSVESYQAYVQLESQTTRRVGALTGGSVVINKSMPSLNSIGSRRGAPPPSRSNSTLSSGSGGVLRSKTSGFV